MVRPWVAGLCSVLLAWGSGCSDRGAQKQVDACRDVARVIDGEIVDDGPLVPMEGLTPWHLESLARSCGWVYEQCDVAVLFERDGRPPELLLGNLVDLCTVPSCPIGPTGSAACERHWREVLDTEEPPDAVRDGLLAYHRSRVDDHLAGKRAELDADDRDRIAEAYTRLWFVIYQVSLIKVSPPRR
jgi:hypothetical protein